MLRRPLLPLVLALALLVSLPGAALAGGEGVDRLPHEFQTPLHVAAPEGDDRVFVVERRGVIYEVANGGDGARRVFADLRTLIGSGGEGGLLSVAFSPDFATDGRFWIYYTQSDRDSRVDRLEVDGTGRADLSSRVRVIEIDQPASNHNGGTIAFAEDGMLLVGLGDGGGSGDPWENGQNTNTLLGSMLRLDVKDRSGSSYGIPADNPFVGRSGRDEIWAYGLRNPYRFSVDPATGDVWIADVGENSREEIDHLPYRPGTAYNLGWDRYEGSRCYEGPCGTSGLTFPVHEYSHGDGRCSITGAGTVRSPGAVLLDGDYVFGDFCGGGVRVYDPGSDRVRRLRGGDIGRIWGSGVDGRGNVYVTTSTRVYRVVDSGTPFRDVGAGDTHADDIVQLADAGVTRGCATELFCPSPSVTRAELAAFLTRAMGYERRSEPFVDVPDGSTFAGDIGALEAEGITNGCDVRDGKRYFCPDELVSRQQLAAFLVRTLGLSPRAEPFADVAADDFYAGDIGAIEAAGITRGCAERDGRRYYCPEADVTRAQVAAFLVRAFDP